MKETQVPFLPLCCSKEQLPNAPLQVQVEESNLKPAREKGVITLLEITTQLVVIIVITKKLTSDDLSEVLLTLIRAPLIFHIIDKAN